MDEIVVKNLTYYYPGEEVPALEEVTFTLKRPFYTIIMGPNGAGKTTLIKVLVGLLKDYLGEVRVYGHDPARERAEISKIVGYVPQLININDLAPIKVREVIEMGLMSLQSPPRIITERDRKKVEEIMEMLKIRKHADDMFIELSGGLRQRVLLARALVKSPKILLLDEPFSMLDFNIKCEIAGLLYEIHRDLNIDVLMVAHEVSPCIPYEPQVIVLNRRIYGIGKASDVLRPEVLSRAYPGITHMGGLMIIGEDHAHHPR